MFAFVQCLRRFRLVCMRIGEAHGHPGRRYQPGCGPCRLHAAERKRALRARKRGLEPLPALPAEVPDASATGDTAPEPGPVVAAVQADILTMGDLTGWQWAAAAAVAMARILDDPRQVPTQPSAVRQLMSLLAALRREVTPRPARLRAVQDMIDRA
jgi:hypothetical protein